MSDNRKIVVSNEPYKSFMDFSNLEAAVKTAQFITSTGMCPKAYQGKPNDAVVAIDFGGGLGLSYMQSLQNIAVINGRPTIWGDAMLAICKSKHTLFEYCNETFDEKTGTAYCEVKRKGQPALVRSFSMDEAKKAGLWGKLGTWQTHPKRMLQMKARSFGLRDAFPDLLQGIYSSEEMEGVDIKDVSPTTPIDASSNIPQTDNVVENIKNKFKAQRGEIIDAEVVDLEDVNVQEDKKEDSISEDTFELLSKMIDSYNITDETIHKWHEYYGVNSLDQITEEQGMKLINAIKRREENDF